MDKFTEIISLLCGAILLIVFIAILLALPVMLLWNWLMPAIFGLIKINFWQALGISLLSSCLFHTNVSTSK